MNVPDDKIDRLLNHIIWLEEAFALRQKKCLECCADLSIQEVRAIVIVAKSEEIMMGALASKMRLAVNSTTVLVDKLVKKQYLERRRTPEDRRVVRVMLTEQGKKVYEATLRVFFEMSRQMLLTLDPSEQDQLLVLLLKINRSIVEADGVI